MENWAYYHSSISSLPRLVSERNIFEARSNFHQVKVGREHRCLFLQMFTTVNLNIHDIQIWETFKFKIFRIFIIQSLCSLQRHNLISWVPGYPLISLLWTVDNSSLLLRLCKSLIIYFDFMKEHSAIYLNSINILIINRDQTYSIVFSDCSYLIVVVCPAKRSQTIRIESTTCRIQFVSVILS